MPIKASTAASIQASRVPSRSEDHRDFSKSPCLAASVFGVSRAAFFLASPKESTPNCRICPHGWELLAHSEKLDLHFTGRKSLNPRKIKRGRRLKNKSAEEWMASILEQTVIGKDSKKEEAKHLAEVERADKARQKQALTLQRRSILSQTANQPARHAALEAALAQIDGQIAQLG
jgi:hypothetical protein